MQLIYLVDDEISAITGKKQRKSQARALAFMGIEYKIRPDGRPLVSRLTFERAMGNTVNSSTFNDDTPNFDTLINGS